jgi:hypothetical protein
MKSSSKWSWFLLVIVFMGIIGCSFPEPMTNVFIIYQKPPWQDKGKKVGSRVAK